jgi:hypothetical protein
MTMKHRTVRWTRTVLAFILLGIFCAELATCVHYLR